MSVHQQGRPGARQAAGVVDAADVEVARPLARAARRPTGEVRLDAFALRDLVAANRILANERIVDGYGHVSARAVENPERFFLARAMAPGLKAADLIEI